MINEMRKMARKDDNRVKIPYEGEEERDKLRKKLEKIIPSEQIENDEENSKLLVSEEYSEEANEIADKFFELRNKKKDAEVIDE
jgi:hypothetical protein